MSWWERDRYNMKLREGYYGKRNCETSGMYGPLIDFVGFGHKITIKKYGFYILFYLYIPDQFNILIIAVRGLAAFITYLRILYSTRVLPYTYQYI